MTYTPPANFVPVLFEFAGAAYMPPGVLVFEWQAPEPPRPLSTIISVEAGVRYRRARLQGSTAAGLHWHELIKADPDPTHVRWGRAQTADRQAALMDWHDLQPYDLDARIRRGTTLAFDAASGVSWYQLPAKDTDASPRWQHARPCDQVRLRIRYKPRVPARDASHELRFGRVDEFGPARSPEQILRDSLYVPKAAGTLLFNFNGSRYNPAALPELLFDFRYTPQQYRSQPVDSINHRIRWGSARQIQDDLRVRWKWATPTDAIPTDVRYPDWDGPVIILPDDPESAGEPELKDTYMIANSIGVTVLPDGTPLAADGFTISRDIDSYSWALDMQLFGRESLELVKPDGSGQKNVRVEINGHVWIFLVTSYTSTGKFPSERFAVKGASRTQLLAEPYALKFSAMNAESINARQAVEDLLVNTGFTLVWDAINENPSDWTITAGALSYTEQTPMQVASRIAESIGAVIKPHPNLDQFSVIPRYRDPVWQWNAPSTFLDRIVPHQVVMDVAGEWSPQPEYNSCYVSGVSYGVAVDVRRAGTAGNEPAPDVYDELITSTDAARMRGIAEICQGGNQEIVTLTIPLFPAETPPGLIQPAMLCEVRPHNASNWRGLCLGTTISVPNMTTVTQKIRLERHHGNS